MCSVDKTVLLKMRNSLVSKLLSIQTSTGTGKTSVGLCALTFFHTINMIGIMFIDRGGFPVCSGLKEQILEIGSTLVGLDLYISLKQTEALLGLGDLSLVVRSLSR